MLKKQNQLYELLNENNSLNEIQDYIRKIITIRGFSEQRVQDKMLPEASIDYEKIENYTDIEEEIADVFIVLVSICNRLNINLYNALKKKEEKNIQRQWKVNEMEKNEQ